MNRFYSILAFLFLAACSFAGELDYSERVEGSSITGAHFTVYDGEYTTMATNSSWSDLFTNRRIVNKVTLGLNPEVQQTTAFSGSASVQIKLWKWVSGSFVTTTVTRTLSVNYDLTGTNSISELATFTDADANRMEITVLSTTGLTLSALYLEGSIGVERIYQSPSLDRVTAIDYDASGDFIDFSWYPQPAAEFYELEWVHINDYETTSGIYLDPSLLPYDFYRNATRVTIAETHYVIPKVFDHGYIVFRVRAIGLKGTDFTVRDEGVWPFADEPGFLDNTDIADFIIPITSEFDPGMNWSHQVAYTENGKRFEGMTFADGMGRGRQSVGVNTVTEQVIVSNPYFDAHGRITLTGLPTPTDGNVMHHFPDFNRANVSGSPSYSADHFDQDFIADDPECALQTLGFHRDYGTGNYYSISNPNLDGPNKLIPDASHFPFARLQYMPDHTGRIQRIGNFGPDFQVGGGHETRFIYSTPNQQELNRLFGSEVGYASHYQRRITIDANHQAYIEYFDLAGRLVASGLAGSTPGNLVELDGGHDPEQDTMVITSGTAGQNQSPVALPISMSTTYLTYVSSESDYTFAYSLDPEQYTSECMPEDICFDCMYNLRIRITDDECGTELFADTLSINGGEYDAICNGTYPFATSTNLHLTEGAYYVEKVLEIDQAAIDGYWCMYLAADTCAASFSELFNQLYDSADFSACVVDTAVADGDPCGVAELLMLQDVSPGGQYALFTTTSGVITTPSPISVLNPSNALGTNHNWKHPSPLYRDANGDTAFIEVALVSVGVYSPPVQTGVTPTGPLSNGNYKILPQQLDSVSDFIDRFENSWAEALLPYHPEYCYLTFCQNNTASHAYDSILGTITTHSAACSGGYYDPLGTGIIPHYDIVLLDDCTATAIDSFFVSGNPGHDYASDMRDSLEDYIIIDGVSLSMWEYAVLLTHCPEAGTSVELGDCLDKYPGDPCTNDQVWLNFRAVYLSVKQEFYQLIADAQPDCDNSCIGDTSAVGTPCSYYSESVSRWNFEQQLNNNIDLSDPSGSLTAIVASACQSQCEGYADDWITALYQCPTLDSLDRTILKADLIAVCVYSCSETNPLGATSLPDTVGTSLVLPSGYGTLSPGATFNDVLALHISGFAESDLCSELLVSHPVEYQPDPFAANYMDTCACTTLLDTDYEFDQLSGDDALPAGVTTVEELLAYNTGLSLEDIDQLICACKAAHDNTWTSGDTWSNRQWENLKADSIVVSVSLNCTQCVTCETVSDAIASLNIRFEDVEDFDQSDNYETILTNYLNQELNLTLTYADYNHFLKKCNASEEHPVCELTPAILSWLDVMNLVAHRGQLVTAEADKINLVTDNIAYPNSALQEALHATYYWSVPSESVLVFKFFGGDTTNCKLNIILPEGADFGFEDIIAFTNIGANGQSCSEANTHFEVEVQYLDCGEIRSAKLAGYTECFHVQECFCGGPVTLCNQTTQDFMADNTPCYEPLLAQLYQDAREQYDTQTAAVYVQFKTDYNTRCTQAFASELFTQSGPFQQYQYTLFYYDQAGNLVKTVAPLGVEILDNDVTINASRDNTTGIDDQAAAVVPDQTYETKYVYNSYDQVVNTTNPDQEDATLFWYDYYGRIVASQNPEQAGEDKYSYTLYDVQGRPIQVGQVVPITPLTEAIVKSPDLGSDFKDWVEDGDLTEVTITTYDRPLLSSGDITAKFKQGKQQNLRLRVAAVAYFDSFVIGTTDPQTDYVSAVHYSYDLHGNVLEAIQDVPQLAPVEQDVKSTQYTFELVSGNVKEVIYQQADRDQMTHRYTYDRLNRLTEVHTSTDGGVHESREAHYRYFDYGPMARVEIGEHKVQANDYAYTINGWLKGMNSNTLDPTRDMGLDGSTGYLASDTHVHELVARDVTGFTMGYYLGDYSGIGALGFEAELGIGNHLTDALKELYNGNIAHTVTAIDGFDVQAGVYTYDQLQRLKEMRVFRGADVVSDNDWVSATETNEYHSNYAYDANGNLVRLNRNGNSTTGIDMDAFAYNLTTVSGNPSNRLDYVDDGGTDYAGYDDIKTGQSSGNYSYDQIGELVADNQEHISRIFWRRGDKKVLKIEHDDATSPQLEFVYNPFGQRVLKIEKPRVDGDIVSEDDWKYTYYAYDANGQVMATYDVTMSGDHNSAGLDELNIYGSGRIGVIQNGRTLYDNGDPLDYNGYGDDGIFINTLGQKKYELTNHLGNVNAVITDRKIVTSPSGLSIYEAVVIMKSDYYPFGMQMPGRNTDTDKYRFGYNGMEGDKELKGQGNSYTTEFRQYDPRLGRWMSLDPLMAQFPGMSPYVVFDDNPVLFIDPYGLSTTNGDVGSDFVRAQKPESETGGEGRMYQPKNSGEPKVIDNPYTEKLVDRRAMPGQTIKLPEDAIVDYSDDGKILESFKYIYKGRYGTVENTYIGKYNEEEKEMRYSAYNSLGEKQSDFYSTWFYSNESEAYKFMWETTQSETGWVGTERTAYITEKGVWVCTNLFCDGEFSFNVLKTEYINGIMYLNGERVLGIIHTHPELSAVGSGGFSSGDRTSSKEAPGIYQIIMEFDNNVSIGAWDSKNNEFQYYGDPPGLTRDAIINGTFKLIPFLNTHRLK